MKIVSLINLGLVFAFLFVFGQSEAQIIKIDSIQDIELKCFGYKLDKCFLLNSKEELQGIMSSWSQHPDCADYHLPEIDFKRYSLIVYHGSYGGSETPRYDLELFKNENTKKLVFKLTVRIQDTARAMAYLYFMKLIPKTNFEVEEQILVIEAEINPIRSRPRDE